MNLATIPRRRVRSLALYWDPPMGTIKEDFKRILKQKMADKGVDKSDLADALKISNSTVRDWLAGRILPEMSRLDDLASFFGVDRWEFLGAPVVQPADAEDALKILARAHGGRFVKDS